MKTEIGGYFELEELKGQEYYSDLYKVNLGRTAIMWLIESRGIKEIWLPRYLCDSVISACEKTGVTIHFYLVNEALEPQLDDTIQFSQDRWLFLVNYYGQLTNETIQKYKKKYNQIIVDNTQSFFQRPVEGVDTVYSCRKFFGLCDGAYLSTDVKLTEGKTLDCSNDRMGHVLGRYEKDAGTYYQAMLDNASNYHDMDIRVMSRLTSNLLKGIDYDLCIEKRNQNYDILKELLPSDNSFAVTRGEGPFAYPYLCENGIELRKKLAAKKVFVPTYWQNVIADMPKDSIEYNFAANILPLPIDQRYGEEEMKFIANLIKTEIQ